MIGIQTKRRNRLGRRRGGFLTVERFVRFHCFSSAITLSRSTVSLSRDWLCAQLSITSTIGAQAHASTKKKICFHEASNNGLIEELSVSGKQINECEAIDEAARRLWRRGCCGDRHLLVGAGNCSQGWAVFLMLEIQNTVLYFAFRHLEKNTDAICIKTYCHNTFKYVCSLILTSHGRVLPPWIRHK